jgi:hypothetical protein
MAKLTKTDLQAHVDVFVNVSKAHYDSYAHAAGYLGGAISTIVAGLPKKQQEEFLRRLQKITAEYAPKPQF